jgi:hypothetical protein
MKYITGGYVGEEEAGLRLFQVAHDPRCSKSGVYWSWNGGPREGRGADALEQDGQILGGGGAGGGWDSIYENDQSDKVLDTEKAATLWKYSTSLTGAQWPPANQPKSPCPTLKVVGAMTNFMNAKEELKRMQPAPGVVGGGLGASTAQLADKVVGGTAGRVVKLAQAKFLGDLPSAALDGSFQTERQAAPAQPSASAGAGLFALFGLRPAAAVVAPAADDVAPSADAARLEIIEERLMGVISDYNATQAGQSGRQGSKVA